MRRALGGFFRSRSPSWRLVAFGRVLHEQPSDDRDDEVGNAEICERGQNPDGLNQPRRYRRGDEGTGPKSAHCYSCDEPAPITKPFYQHRYGTNIRKAEAQTADESVAKIEPPEFIRVEAR